MIDLRAARADPDTFRRALARKGGAAQFDELLAADERWRELETRAGELRAKRKLSGKPTPEQLEELNRVKKELAGVEEQLVEADRQRQALWALVPTPPDPSAPDGSTEDDAEVLRTVGEQPEFAFEPLDHLALARGGIDMERGARLSGSRFAYRLGDVALLELALYRWALERIVGKGFVPVLPPVLVREPAMYGTGFLPTDDVNIYYVERDELYLTGTSEVALAGLHMDEILDETRTSYRSGTPASRRTSAARPARRERTRAACSACTSSTRSRCSSSACRSSRPSGTTNCSRSRRSSSPSSGSPTAW
jgi:seryl-tRNA synthetase